MKRLKLTHFLQDPCYCAVAASAVVANYFDPEIDYVSTKKIADKIFKDVDEEGIATEQTAILLNHLGFHKVTVVSSDMDIFDYEWENYGRRKMTKTLKDAIAHKKCKISKARLKMYYKWHIDRRYENVITISYNFGRYIRQHLNRKKPVIVSFNWTMFMKFAKEAEKGGPDPINGDEQQHAVVLNGYDKKGVWIVDSHHRYYKYKRKKYGRGFYKMSWENLFTCMGQGDVILPGNYYIEE